MLTTRATPLQPIRNPPCQWLQLPFPSKLFAVLASVRCASARPVPLSRNQLDSTDAPVLSTQALGIGPRALPVLYGQMSAIRHPLNQRQRPGTSVPEGSVDP